MCVAGQERARKHRCPVHPARPPGRPPRPAPAAGSASLHARRRSAAHPEPEEITKRPWSSVLSARPFASSRNATSAGVSGHGRPAGRLRRAVEPLGGVRSHGSARASARDDGAAPVVLAGLGRLRRVTPRAAAPRGGRRGRSARRRHPALPRCGREASDERERIVVERLPAPARERGSAGGVVGFVREQGVCAEDALGDVDQLPVRRARLVASRAFRSESIQQAIRGGTRRHPRRGRRGHRPA